MGDPHDPARALDRALALFLFPAPSRARRHPSPVLRRSGVAAMAVPRPNATGACHAWVPPQSRWGDRVFHLALPEGRALLRRCRHPPPPSRVPTPAGSHHAAVREGAPFLDRVLAPALFLSRGLDAPVRRGKGHRLALVRGTRVLATLGPAALGPPTMHHALATKTARPDKRAYRLCNLKNYY